MPAGCSFHLGFSLSTNITSSFGPISEEVSVSTVAGIGVTPKKSLQIVLSETYGTSICLKKVFNTWLMNIETT